MKHLKALVMMQLKDKLDFSFLGSTQRTISKIVFSVLKFIIVTAVSYVVFMLLPMFIFTGGRVPSEIMVFIFGIIFILSIISSMIGLMKNLYLSDDNKVLITFPVNANMIFVSKLIVYYIFELKRSLFLTIPIFLGYELFTGMGVWHYIWLFIAFIFISAVPVLIGALLSIPALYVNRFFKKIPVVKILVYMALAVVIVLTSIKVISLIPENINLIEQGGAIERAVKDGLYWCNDHIYPVNLMVSMIVGYLSGFEYSIFHANVLTYFCVTVGGIAFLSALAFFISRPIFFTMMSKSFEFEKKLLESKKPNKKRGKITTFFKTELSSLLRSGITATFVVMYIAVPLLIYLLNKIFAAMDTDLEGKYMAYSFNLLIMILPIMASNGVIATLYSRDGRVAYLKKTFPLNPMIPIVIKVVPMLIGSAISLCASMVVFSRFVDLQTNELVLLCVGLIGLQWGHVFQSVTMDLMNPQNELYATTGNVDDNPNETSSTVIAFIVSAVFAFFSFILFPEGLTTACVKLALIGVVFMLALVYMFVSKMKVYFYEK